MKHEKSTEKVRGREKSTIQGKGSPGFCPLFLGQCGCILYCIVIGKKTEIMPALEMQESPFLGESYIHKEYKAIFQLSDSKNR